MRFICFYEAGDIIETKNFEIIYKAIIRDLFYNSEVNSEETAEILEKDSRKIVATIKAISHNEFLEILVNDKLVRVMSRKYLSEI